MHLQKNCSEVGILLAKKIEEKGNFRDTMENIQKIVEQLDFFFLTTNTEIAKLLKGLKTMESKGNDNIP